MTARDDLDRELDAFLRDGPTELPQPSFYAVRDRTESTRQRVVIGPWRMTDPMNRFAAIGLGAAAVVVALVVGIQFLGPTTPGGAGAAPSASPSLPSAPAATPTAAAASASVPPPLSETLTSSVQGISMSFPAGWSTKAATAPWTSSTFPLEFDGQQADVMYDPTLTSSLFLTVASQPIGDLTPDEWTARQMASEEGCTTTKPIAIDTARGLIGAEGCDVAVVTTAGRGYWIQLYTSDDDPLAVAPYDRAWFESVLATIRLQPGDAVGSAPSATFTSERNGISIGYPAGWTARPATESWTSGIPDFMTPGGDVIYEPTNEGNLWLMVASQPLAGKSPEQWTKDLLAELGAIGECGPPGDPVTVDGAQGQWCGDNVVAVPSRDRGYAIRLYTSGDDPAIAAKYNRAWFEDVLATVKLDPEAAVAAAP